MTVSYYTRQLLTPDELNTAADCLNEGAWSKSRELIPEYLPNGQNNSEMVSGSVRLSLSRLILQKNDSDQGFNDFVFPRSNTDLIVSRTGVGEGFFIHYDTTSVGEFSTTVFLSEPDTYEGGELCLHLEGQVQKFKLPAGHAITYLTGAPHCVAEVTAGVRYAGVFWTASLVRDVRYRDILSSVRRARRLLPTSKTYDFDQATSDPEFILQSVEHKLIRHFL